MEKLSVECRPVTPENLAALLRFMEERAFADNPHWAGCYCVFHYLADSEDGLWADRTGAQNRARLSSMVKAGAGSWIAAHHPEDGRVVGYVNADMRPRLHRYDEWGTPSDSEVGIVACFVVDPSLRHRGIATQLLEAATDSLWSRGARRVDAYTMADPAKEARESEDGMGEDQMAHHGPLAMYLAAGFRVLDREGSLAHVVRDRPVPL
jgi:GNAT superfamily N-acetyltransferase